MPKVFWGPALAMMLASTSVRAQGNYRSAALGGRSALMGDTGVALGTDSAAPFLNPATIVAERQPTLSLSINILGRIVHAPNWYAPGPVDAGLYGNVPQGGADITRVSGSAIPSTFCFFQPLKRIEALRRDRAHAGQQTFAACFGTTELDQFDWVGQSYQAANADRSTTQSSSVRHAWQRFVLTPTYAIQVTDWLAFGASIQGGLTNYSSFAGVGATTAGGALPTSTVFESGVSGSDFDLNVLVGATLTYRRFTIGVTAQSPDVSLYGHGNVSSQWQLAGATNAMSSYLGEGSFHARSPARFALGVGYKWPRGSVELDTQLALADGRAIELDSHGTQVDLGARAPASLLLATRYQPTFNASIGGEVYVSRAFSLLAGFGTDLSAIDALTPTSVAASRINRILLSFGGGSHGDNGSLVIGVQGYYGFGEGLAPNIYAAEPTLTATPMQTYGALVVVAGTTNVRAIEGAVRAVKQAFVHE